MFLILNVDISGEYLDVTFDFIGFTYSQETETFNYIKYELLARGLGYPKVAWVDAGKMKAEFEMNEFAESFDYDTAREFFQMVIYESLPVFARKALPAN